ncbi:MAG: nucleoside-diphosphate kinase [Rickettsiales bacterium]|nr:nucleoside-diphosphate kinase [Rickettsiales bacterium]
MEIEYTLSIIKPDAMKRNLSEEINKMFTDSGFKIVAQKEMNLTKQMAEEFYSEHKERPFYADLVTYMSSGPVIVQVLAGKNVIVKNREIMGETDPKNAAEGTIRKKYGLSIDHNSIHGSDSVDSAKREINFFFDYDKLASEG